MRKKFTKRPKGNSNKREDKDEYIPESKDSKFSSKSEGMHGYNDVSWYTKNAQMLMDAASYSYNTPLGFAVQWSNLFTDPDNNLDWGRVTGKGVPGLMSLGVVCCPSRSINSTSPANIAAQNIYSYVRYMNSGSKNYDQADLMLYLLAMDQIYAYWNWAKRIYGYISQYSQYNRYMPRAYALADNVNIDDLWANISDLREWLNKTAAQISAFCVPAVMPFFLRHSWMFSNIYKDSDTLKAQQYQFTPTLWYYYDETGSANGGQLYAFYPNNAETHPLLTFQDIITNFNKMFNKIAYSEDVGVMSGDILKAYGQDKLFMLSPVTPDYVVTPVYNEEVLNQIHNSTVIPTPTTIDASFNITQDPDNGYLVYNPVFSNLDYYSSRIMLNMPWDNVTPANTMVGSRLTAAVAPTGNSFYFSALGSEFIARRKIIYFVNSQTLQVWEQTSNMLVIPYNTTDPTSVASMLTAASLISNFDWHPLTMMVVKPATGKAQAAGILGDINNYTVIQVNDLQKMHLTAVMSEFNIPQIGSY